MIRASWLWELCDAFYRFGVRPYNDGKELSLRDPERKLIDNIVRIALNEANGNLRRHGDSSSLNMTQLAEGISYETGEGTARVTKDGRLVVRFALIRDSLRTAMAQEFLKSESPNVAEDWRTEQERYQMLVEMRKQVEGYSVSDKFIFGINEDWPRGKIFLDETDQRKVRTGSGEESLNGLIRLQSLMRSQEKADGHSAGNAAPYASDQSRLRKALTIVRRLERLILGELTFVVSHELGHVALKHGDAPTACQELEADEFAGRITGIGRLSASVVPFAVYSSTIYPQHGFLLPNDGEARKLRLVYAVSATALEESVGHSLFLLQRPRMLGIDPRDENGEDHPPYQLRYERALRAANASANAHALFESSAAYLSGGSFVSTYLQRKFFDAFFSGKFRIKI